MEINFFLPSTAFVEKKAKFFVSKGFSLVNSILRDCGSDSPVNDELSTLRNILEQIKLFLIYQHLCYYRFNFNLMHT